MIVLISFMITFQTAVIAQFRVLGLFFKNIRKQATDFVDLGQRCSVRELDDTYEVDEIQMIEGSCLNEVQVAHSSRDVPGDVSTSPRLIVIVHHPFVDRHADIVHDVNVASGEDVGPTRANTESSHQVSRTSSEMESDRNLSVRDTSHSVTSEMAMRSEFLADKKKKRREKEMKRNFEVQQVMRVLLREYLKQHLHLLKYECSFIYIYVRHCYLRI